jgi:hypothetical protein
MTHSFIIFCIISQIAGLAYGIVITLKPEIAPGRSQQPDLTDTQIRIVGIVLSLGAILAFTLTLREW